MKDLQKIYKAACTASKVDIKSKKRDRDTYAFGRFAYYIVAKKTTKHKDGVIAKHIGYDRAMVIHAQRNYDSFLLCPAFVRIITRIYKSIGVEFTPPKKGKKEVLKTISPDSKKLMLEISKLKDKKFSGVLNEFKDLLSSLSAEGIEEAKVRLEPFVKMYNSRKTYENTTREERG